MYAVMSVFLSVHLEKLTAILMHAKLLSITGFAEHRLDCQPLGNLLWWGRSDIVTLLKIIIVEGEVNAAVFFGIDIHADRLW